MKRFVFAQMFVLIATAIACGGDRSGITTEPPPSTPPVDTQPTPPPILPDISGTYIGTDTTAVSLGSPGFNIAHPTDLTLISFGVLRDSVSGQGHLGGDPFNYQGHSGRFTFRAIVRDYSGSLHIVGVGSFSDGVSLPFLIGRASSLYCPVDSAPNSCIQLNIGRQYQDFIVVPLILRR